MLSNDFASHTRKRVGTLHVNKRCGGEIEHYELRRCRLSANTAQDYVDDIVHVEIDETRFRTENHDVRNQFVVRMAVAIRETGCSRNSPEKTAVRMSRCRPPLQKRNCGP